MIRNVNHYLIKRDFKQESIAASECCSGNIRKLSSEGDPVLNVPNDVPRHAFINGSNPTLRLRA